MWRIVGVLCVLCLNHSLAGAQNWVILHDSSTSHLDRGDLKTSTKLLEQALAVVDNGHDNSEGFLTISNDLALNYLSLGKYHKAEDLFNRYLRADFRPESNIVKSNLALVYINLARYDTAKSLLNSALKELRSITGTSHPEFLNALNNLAIVQYKMGNYMQAERIYKTGIGQLLNSGMGETTDFANWLNNLALLYNNLARYEDALKYYGKAREIYKKTLGAKSEEVAFVDINLGSLYSDLGEFDKAKIIFTKSKRIIRKSHPQYAALINNLGQSYYLEGKWKLADKYFSESLNLKEDIYGEFHPSIAATLKGSAALKVSLGDYLSAIKMLYRAISIEKATFGEGHPDLIDTYQQLAKLKLKIKDFKGAEKLLNQSKEGIIKMYSKNHPQYARVLESLAEVEMINDLQHAEIMIKESLSITEGIPGVDPQTSISARKILAEILYRKEEFGRSIDELNKIVEFTQSSFSNDHPSLGEIYQKLAFAYIASNQTEKAYGSFIKGLNNYTGQIHNYFPFLIESEKIRFYNSLTQFYEQFNSFAGTYLQQFPQITADLYNYQLATKALLLNATGKWKKRIKNSGDLNLIKKFSDWQIKSEQIQELRALSFQELQKRGISIKSLENEIESLEKELLLRSNHFANLKDNGIIGWNLVKDKLEQDEAAVEILKYRSYDFQERKFLAQINYAALVISPGSNLPKFVSIPGGNELENKWLKQYRNTILYKLEDKQSYNYFWKPLATAIPGKNKIYISPDGVYNQINLNTLRNPETGDYVLDESNIQLLTNTKDLIKEDLAESFNKFALLIGNPDFNLALPNINDQESKMDVDKIKLKPLPGTEQEIANLEELLEENDWEVEKLSEKEATEVNLKSAFKPKLMHIATHGFFEERKNDTAEIINPLLSSGLMLAGADNYFGSLSSGINGDREDGLLTAAEAMSLNIDNTELVVLSACETGLGKFKNGEGVYGLQRSFNIAGARSLIMSLWKIDDSATQQLMNNFYENWFSGLSKDLAFKKAQLKLREVYPEPYYWGAFILVGQ